MLLISEHITCPYCWERIEVSLDLSITEQRYVEDCFVCCRPINIHCVAADGCLQTLEVDAEDA